MKISLSTALVSKLGLYLFSTGIAIALATVSCSTKKTQRSADPDINPGHQAGRYIAFDQIETRILDEYRRWQGTRHKMGGTGSRGIDCSGFVKEVYRDAFNIKLPRTTRMQAELGKPVAFDKLRPGDLVFFKPPTYARHVGIYLNRSEFVHASKKEGVTISRIDTHYWGKYYWTARRILPAPKNR